MILRKLKEYLVMSKLDSLNSEVSNLTNENLSLKKEIESYKAMYEESRDAYTRLMVIFKQSQRREFGQSSERFLDKNIAQEDMFSAVNAQPPPAGKDYAENTDSKPPESKARKPRKKKNNNFAKELPRREVIIPVKDKGPDDKVIRYKETELINYVPPIYEIIVQKREVVVSKKESSNVSTITTAPNPPRILPRARVTEEFLAYMIVSKLYDRQPLYHLEKKFNERFDFICPRNKLARWFIESAKHSQPLVNLLQDTMLDYDVAACDPTHIQVLNEPGRAPTKKSYMFTMRGGPPDKTTILYQYNADNHKAFLQQWFEGYKGYLQVDGQNIFDVFEDNKDIILLYCNSHARRKFEPIAKATTQSGLADEAMNIYQSLYAIERQAKEDAMTPAQRHQLRHENTKPLLDKFEIWIKEKSPLTLPKSPLGKAFAYVDNRMVGLRRFLDDGRLEVDTNVLEQSNKNLALGRNNFLFAYSVDGVNALGNHMSLVFTALEHGLDPYHYYVHIMKRIPHCKTVEDYEALLPWNVTLMKTHTQQKVAYG